MHINRSQQYQYFQNKANHYRKLRTIKPKIDDSSPYPLHPQIKMRRVLPFLSRNRIEAENSQLMDRLISIAGSHQSQVLNEGYSRYFNINRPFRKRNPQKCFEDRQNEIENRKREERILMLKPAVGISEQWSRSYEKYKQYRRNASLFTEDSKSKISSSLSADKCMPDTHKDASEAEKIQLNAFSKKRKGNVLRLYSMERQVMDRQPIRSTESSVMHREE